MGKQIIIHTSIYPHTTSIHPKKHLKRQIEKSKQDSVSKQLWNAKVILVIIHPLHPPPTTPFHDNFPKMQPPSPSFYNDLPTILNENFIPPLTPLSIYKLKLINHTESSGIVSTVENYCRANFNICEDIEDVKIRFIANYL